MTMTHRELNEFREKLTRLVRTTRTYVRKSEDYLYGWRNAAPDYALPTEYWTLVEQLLDTAHAIVKYLPDDLFQTTTERSFLDGSPFEFNHAEFAVGERLAKLTKLYDERAKSARRSDRIRKLENTTGRTPEEAEAYRLKAAELRARRSK